MDIAHITDLHISKDITQKKHSCVAYQSLIDTLSAIESNHKNIKNLVITGDLSSDYSLESYLHIKNLLGKYPFKVSLLPGNHDDLKKMEMILDEQISIENIDLSDIKILAYNFDTHVPGRVHGKLQESDIKNLMQELNNLKTTNQIILFTHHPLVPVGSKWIDEHICENSEFLIETLLSYKKLNFQIFCGHVHQDSYLKKNNIEFYSTPSTCYQFKPYSDEFDIDKNVSYGYRVISLQDTAINSKVIRVVR
jgi:Icc protein